MSAAMESHELYYDCIGSARKAQDDYLAGCMFTAWGDREGAGSVVAISSDGKRLGNAPEDPSANSYTCWLVRLRRDLPLPNQAERFFTYVAFCMLSVLCERPILIDLLRASRSGRPLAWQQRGDSGHEGKN